MSSDPKLVRCDDLLEADVNGEIVALHIEKGQCYGMNAVASRIWELLRDPISREAICDVLTEEYEIDGPSCRREVDRLIEEFKSEGLVRPA